MPLLPLTSSPLAPSPLAPARRLLSLLLVTLTGLLLVAGPAAAASDDYPYRTDTSGAADRWGFTRRQCVSFVAWRVEQDGVRLRNSAQHWGSALSWDEAARRLGYRVGTKPVAGAIAQWNAGERSAYYAPGSAKPTGNLTAGAAGHVGFVHGVYADGSVWMEQYNLRGDRRWSATRVRAPRYMYVGVQPPR